MNSDMFHLNALKAFMDGTGAGMTAYMLTPYKTLILWVSLSGPCGDF